MGAMTGFVGYAGVVYWTRTAMVAYGGLSRPVSLLVLLALIGYLALFTTVFGGLAALSCRWAGPQAVVATPVLWVGCELARNYPWGGFPWCLLGYSQVGVLPVVQLASVTGIYGVSLLLVLVNAVIAYALTGPGRKRVLSAGFPVAVLLGLVLTFGFRELRTPLPEPSFPVAAVQGNVLQENKWEPDHAVRIFARHIELSWRGVERGARLIVWPESSTPFHFDGTPRLAEHMKRFAREAQVYLLFGSDDYEQDAEGYRAYNGAKLITPKGDIHLRYRKNILVPFGEYVPNQELFFFAEKLTDGVSDFSPGQEVLVADVEDGKLGVFICYEAIFTELVRQFVGKGAGLLVNVTNDAWFGRSSAPYQHLEMAIARAVETRRYLVRAANTGITAIVDPYGRILARSELFVPDVVFGKVSFRNDETLFVRYGNVIGHASGVATAAFFVFAVVAAYREKTRGY